MATVEAQPQIITSVAGQGPGFNIAHGGAAFAVAAMNIGDTGNAWLHFVTLPLNAVVEYCQTAPRTGACTSGLLSGNDNVRIAPFNAGAVATFTVWVASTADTPTGISLGFLLFFDEEVSSFKGGHSLRP